MAKYLKKTGIRYLSDVKSGIESFSTKITVDDSGSSMIISIWDKFILTYSNKNATDAAAFTLSLSGSQVASGNTKLYYGNVSLEIIEDDSFLYLKIGPDGSSQKMENNICVVELKENDDVYTSYVSYSASSGFDYYTIENLSFSNEDGITGLTTPKLFQYAAYPGTIDYSEKSVFVGGQGRISSTTVFKSCSNVSYLSTVEINGTAYLAIGTNHVIEIDPIEI